MLKQPDVEITREQEALISVYREKWRKFAFSSSRINQEKAQEALEAAYDLIGYNRPEQIIFFSSPREVSRWIIQQTQVLNNNLLLQNQDDLVYAKYSFNNFFLQEQIIATHLEMKLSEKHKLTDYLSPFQQNKLLREIDHNFTNQGLIYRAYLTEIKKDVYNSLKNLEETQRKEILISISNPLKPEKLAIEACKLDFALSVLNYNNSQKSWEICQKIVENCGWIYPFEKICLVCDRPVKLSFDGENRSHAEGDFALSFGDGFGLYAFRGRLLPEKYGKLHPNQWQGQWLLEESNAELRRVLIEGIGYGRLCVELDVLLLDSWREYSLLLINYDLDLEPIHLLKMICPSTGHIHVLRVPPEIATAREAIAWANWGIDPEEFSIST